MDDTTNVPIAIVGAGPGGLLLALYLQKHLPKPLVPLVKIFESDASRQTRSQGGTLDLHWDTGLYALKSVGLTAKFNEKARKGGEEMRIVDAVSGEVLLSDEGGGFRPEIDRADLRDIMLDSLLPDTIHYGHHLTSVAPSPKGKSWKLSFRVSESNDPLTVTTRILVGADGAWSKIRPLLTPAHPIYTGLSFLDLQILPSTISQYPELTEYVDQGAAFIVSDTERGLIPQRNTSGIIKIYAGLKVPENWLDEHPLEAGEVERRTQIRSWFPGFSPKVLTFLDAADSASIVPRKIYALPPDLTWARPPTTTEGAGGIVTLLGDSAHVMSPMAGEGVNLALRDAVDLGKALVKGLRSPELREAEMQRVNSAIEAYEAIMFRRAKQAGDESAQNLDIFFSKAGPGALVEIMKSHMPPAGFGVGMVMWWMRMLWSEGWKYAEREGWW